MRKESRRVRRRKKQNIENYAKNWLLGFFLFAAVLLVKSGAASISSIITDGAPAGIFLKNYIIEGFSLIVALAVIRRFKLVDFKAKADVSTLVLGVLALLACQMIGSLFGESEDDDLFLLIESYKLIAFLAIVVLAPVAEELFFRGMLYNLLWKDNNFTLLPILVSSLMFAITHTGLPTQIYGFFAGIVYARIYEESGSIWNSVACHGLINLIVLCVQIFL